MSQILPLTLTISDIADFVEKQIQFFINNGSEIPDFVYISNDVVKALVTNAGHLTHDGYVHLVFQTSAGELSVMRVKDKTNYIAVGGVDYLTMLAEEELLKE